MRINVGESLMALAIVVFAGAMAYIGSFYPRGTLGAMGAGYFPMMISIATVAIGLVVLASVVLSTTTMPAILWRPALLTLAAMLSWAVLAERFGLVPASLALILLASLAQPPLRVRSAVLTAVLASAAAVAIFIYGFDLPLRPLKW